MLQVFLLVSGALPSHLLLTIVNSVPKAGKELSILVIDDNVEDGSLIEANLAGSGYTRCLHFCATTAEAQEILKNSRYDVIITDHRPPALDSFHLLTTLAKADNPTPVLVITGCGTEKLAADAIKCGAYDYLTKEELSTTALAHIIATVLERRRLKEEARVAGEQLKQMAIKDALTQTYNRRYFQERLEEEFARSQRYHRPLSIIMLDVDYFKEVNDRAGHLAGDRVLTQIAQVLVQTLRCVDIISRFGGDEFAILLPETSHQDAATLAERLRQRIKDQSIFFEGAHLSTTISIGLASLGPGIANTRDLVATADSALYQAKTLGRNQVYAGLPPAKKKVSQTKQSG